MKCKVFLLFVKTLTADDKYSLLSRHNSMQTIQITLSEKQKKVLNFYVHFLILHKFSTFLKKDEPHSLCVSEITDHEKRG